MNLKMISRVGIGLDSIDLLAAERHGIIVKESNDYETFKKSWDALETKSREDPYAIHPVMVESERGGRNMAQWINLTGSLSELEFIELRMV